MQAGVLGKYPTQGNYPLHPLIPHITENQPGPLLAKGKQDHRQGRSEGSERRERKVRSTADI